MISSGAKTVHDRHEHVASDDQPVDSASPSGCAGRRARWPPRPRTPPPCAARTRSRRAPARRRRWPPPARRPRPPWRPPRSARAPPPWCRTRDRMRSRAGPPRSPCARTPRRSPRREEETALEALDEEGQPGDDAEKPDQDASQIGKRLLQHHDLEERDHEDDRRQVAQRVGDTPREHAQDPRHGAASSAIPRPVGQARRVSRTELRPGRCTSALTRLSNGVSPIGYSVAMGPAALSAPYSRSS